jgi:hypothetical protein
MVDHPTAGWSQQSKVYMIAFCIHTPLIVVAILLSDDPLFWPLDLCLNFHNITFPFHSIFTILLHSLLCTL